MYFIQKYIPCDKKSPFWKMWWHSWKNEKSIRKAYTIIMFVWNFHACITFCTICPNFQTNIFHYNSIPVLETIPPWDKIRAYYQSFDFFFRVLFEWGNHGGWPSGLQSKNVPLSLHSDRKQLFHYGPGQISVQRSMESHYCDDPSEVFGRSIFERAYLYNGKAYILGTERSLPIDNTSYFISIWIHQ